MDKCKAALCVEISETLGFDGSNLAFSPKFGADAMVEFERLCNQLCDSCPMLDAAQEMAAQRLKRETPSRGGRVD